MSDGSVEDGDNGEWNKERVDALIDNGIEESLELEYKSGRALRKTDNKKNKLSKTVSSFANSAGGTVIYGVKEHDEDDKQHLPEKIEPADRSEVSKESLEQILNSRIRPKIDGLEITPISLEGTDVIYAVEVPKSDTAHQASDHRYYKRQNFSSVPMEDYEVRDVMNRAKSPKIEVECVVVEEHYVGKLGDPDIDGFEIPQNRLLVVCLENHGQAVAEYVNGTVEIPTEVLDTDDSAENDAAESRKAILIDNTERDVVDVDMVGANVHERYGASWFNPIQPDFRKVAKKINLDRTVDLEGRVEWEVVADDAGARSGVVELSEVEVVRERID